MNNNRPTRCIDPVVKYCPQCKYGLINYPDWVENYDNTFGCDFESYCLYGLENTKPTEEELKEFENWLKKRR